MFDKEDIKMLREAMHQFYGEAFQEDGFEEWLEDIIIGTRQEVLVQSKTTRLIEPIPETICIKANDGLCIVRVQFDTITQQHYYDIVMFTVVNDGNILTLFNEVFAVLGRMPKLDIMFFTPYPVLAKWVERVLKRDYPNLSSHTYISRAFYL